jgi:FixJ family two-component response regulator
MAQSTQEPLQAPPLSGLVCVVDDDGQVRRGLERLIRSWRMKVEGFSSATAYLAWKESAPLSGPCCLVLDVCMPGLDGLHLQQSLADRGVPIIFLTGHGDVPTCAAAMKAGAVDFLTKPVEEDNLMAAITTALQASVSMQKDAQEKVSARSRYGSLTHREAEVMSCVIAGLLNKQIADQLGAAEKTIKVHRGRVMEKMGVYSVADLVRAAQAVGITPFEAGARA